MKNKPFWIVLIGLLVLQFYLGSKVTPDLTHVAEAPHKLHEIAGIEIPYGGINFHTIKVTWGVMGLLIILAFFAGRGLKKIPGRFQLCFELFVGAFDTLCRDTLGAKGRFYLPMVATLFLFICLANWVSFFPIPGFEEPTKDLNTTLSLGLICFLVAHISSIRYKGIVRYISDYFEPMIEIKGVKIPNIIFAPLNVIGEIGKLVSHSFRLYGNILGGSIIVQVISNLTHYVILPIGLNFYFGLFAGAIQAFVFAMLALTYVAVLIE